MALVAGEIQSGGEVRDADGRLVIVVDAGGTLGLLTGEMRSDGQVRDADGRRVVKAVGS